MQPRDLFEILVREHAAMLGVYLRSAVSDPGLADDRFQETVIAAWRDLERYDRERPFGAWLRGIAAKQVLAARRRGARGLVLTGSARTLLGRLDPNLQGCDRFAGTLAGAFVGPFGYELWPRTVDGTTALSRTYATTDAVDDALAFIAEHDGPWFVNLSFHAPHTPSLAPPDDLHGQDLPDSDPCDEPIPFHDASVEALDRELGRLLASLPLATRARTTVVFVWDNGTTPGVAQPPLESDAAKGTLYQGGIRVPLIVAGPTVRAAGTEFVCAREHQRPVRVDRRARRRRRAGPTGRATRGQPLAGVGAGVAGRRPAGLRVRGAVSPGRGEVRAASRAASTGRPGRRCGARAASRSASTTAARSSTTSGRIRARTTTSWTVTARSTRSPWRPMSSGRRSSIGCSGADARRPAARWDVDPAAALAATCRARCNAGMDAAQHEAVAAAARAELLAHALRFHGAYEDHPTRTTPGARSSRRSASRCSSSSASRARSAWR